MTREDIEFKVVDAKTGVDITHSILTQIIMDEEAGGEQMLPTNFLRQLISMYGNSMQGLLPGYLEDSIGTNPLAQMAQRNMEMFKAAATAFVPGGRGAANAPGAGEKDEIAVLRAQMAEMQKKLDQLSK